MKRIPRCLPMRLRIRLSLAETDLSLVASERVEVEQAHSLKEVFRPPGLFRWFGFGLGKSSPSLDSGS